MQNLLSAAVSIGALRVKLSLRVGGRKDERIDNPKNNIPWIININPGL